MRKTLKALVRAHRYTILIFSILTLFLLVNYTIFILSASKYTISENTRLVIIQVKPGPSQVYQGNPYISRPIVLNNVSDYMVANDLLTHLYDNIIELHIYYRASIGYNNILYSGLILVPIMKKYDNVILLSNSNINSDHITIVLSVVKNYLVYEYRLEYNDFVNYNFSRYISRNYDLLFLLTSIMFGRSNLVAIVPAEDLYTGYNNISGGLIAALVSGVDNKEIIKVLDILSKKYGVAIEYKIIEYDSIKDVLMDYIINTSGHVYAQASSFLLLPAVISVALLSTGVTREIESLSVILESRGRSKLIAWSPLFAVPLLFLFIIVIFSLIDNIISKLVVGASFLVATYLLVVALALAARRAPSPSKRLLTLLGGAATVVSIVLFKTGAAAYVGLAIYGAVSGVLGVATSKFIGTLVALSYYLVTVKVLLVALLLGGLYVVVERILPALSRGLSGGVARGLLAMLVAASVIAPVAAPAVIAMPAALEASYGANIVYRVYPGVDADVYRSMVSMPGVKVAAGIRSLGSVTVGWPLAVEYTVACYDSDFVEFLHEASSISLAAYVLAGFFSNNPIVADPSVPRNITIRIGETNVSLASAVPPPSAMGTAFAHILVPCSLLDNETASRARVTFILAIAEPSVVDAWNRTVNETVGDASIMVSDNIREGFQLIRDTGLASPVLSLVIAAGSLLAVGIVFRRLADNPVILSSLAILRARGAAALGKGLAPAGLLALLILAIGAWITWLVLFPLRVGYADALQLWYLIQALSFVFVILSPLLLFALYLRLARSDEVV